MFQKFRTVLFWLHLVLGVVGGIFIFSMSVSGTLIAFEKQITNWMESGQRFVKVPEGAKALEPETLIAKVQEARPTVALSGITLYSDPQMAARFNTGGRGGPQGVLYANPYTAEVLGDGDPNSRGLFRFLISFHRWFALPGDWKAVGEWINGVAVLAFLAIMVTGIVIWMPRRWTWRALKPITTFDPKLTGKARDWNWHNVLGIWSFPVILFIALTGTIIAHKWASNLLFTLTGSPVPQERQGGGGQGGQGGGQGGAQGQGRGEGQGERTAGGGARGEGRGEGREGRGEGRGEGRRSEGGGGEGRGEGRMARGEGGAGANSSGGTAPAGSAPGAPTATPAPAPKINVTGENAMWAAARAKVPGWQFISHQISANPRGNADFTIDSGTGQQPYLTDTLTLNRTTAAEEKWAPYDSQNAGQKLRRWARFGHTGEALGIFGQIIAFLGALSTAVLVYTGLFLTWRRYFGKHVTAPATKATVGKAAGADASAATAPAPTETAAAAAAATATGATPAAKS